MKRQACTLLLVAAAVLVSGCTQSPGAEAEEQADRTRQQLMQQMEDQATEVDIMAAFERSGDTVLQLRNTGTRAVSTGNITVIHSGEEYICTPVQDIAPGQSGDCGVNVAFPEVGESKVFQLSVDGSRTRSFNCSVRSGEEVAC